MVQMMGLVPFLSPRSSVLVPRSRGPATGVVSVGRGALCQVVGACWRSPKSKGKWTSSDLRADLPGLTVGGSPR